MDIHHNHLALSGAEVHLLVVGRPNAAGDCGLQIKHGGPIPLTSHGSDQNEAILVADQGHAAIVRPGEVGYRRIPIVDQLDGPAALVLDPHKDDARAVAGGQFLVRLVPFDQDDLLFKYLFIN